jgi:hypothetical protein
MKILEVHITLNLFFLFLISEIDESCLIDPLNYDPLKLIEHNRQVSGNIKYFPNFALAFADCFKNSSILRNCIGAKH